MFEIDLKYKMDSDLPVITDNYEILHFDEHPILFTGTNRFGNKLLGSFSYEDEETDLFRYFVVMLDNKQFSSFYNKMVSYRDLILASKEVFIIDKNINEKVISKFLVPASYIPDDYLPLSSSFIPEGKVISKSLNFTFSLKGKLADLHKALVNDLNIVNQKIHSYLQESLDALSIFNLNPKVYAQPSQPGSYRLNFDVEFKQEPQTSLFPVNEVKVSEFINRYLNYIAYTFPNESDGFLEKYTSHSKDFNLLKDSFEDIFKSSGLESRSTVSDILIDNINNTAEKLSEVTEFLKDNDSFNTIEVGKIDDSGSFTTIGYLIDDYKVSIKSKLLPDEELVSTDNVIEDETPASYRILVFRINLETGKGGARLYFDDSENFHKIKLNIHKEDNNLSNSLFTKSINENKVVNVNGVATKINGVYKNLDCYI